MKSIESEVNLSGKKVLLRLDLNVPLKDKKITDTNRIDKIIPTLKFLINKNAKVIIISHVGRPKGEFNENLSLYPICENISDKINNGVKLIKENLKNLKSLDNYFENYKILALENIRFYKEEENNDEDFARNIAKLGDIYVNDAFSCSHREHATVSKITSFMPSFSGIQFNLEVSALKKITTDIKKPITCIIGGSKISTKIQVIKNLIKKFDNIIIVGGMANNILKFKGYDIGKSIFEPNVENIINETFIHAEKYNCKISYPVDLSVGKNLEDSSKNITLEEIQEDDLILDIGRETIKNIFKIIDGSKTVLWNGPAGYFENANFSKGSFEIGNRIASREHEIYSVAGGGDTVAVLNKFNLTNKFNFVSTAGGAFLEYLEGKILPGIKALN